MNATTDHPAEMKTLSHATQNSLLAPCEWEGHDKKRVLCTYRTKGLLQHAGIPDPLPLHSYAVPVAQDGKGFWFVLPARAGRQPQGSASGDESLFSTGGIFAKDAPPDFAEVPAAARQKFRPQELAEFFAEVLTGTPPDTTPAAAPPIGRDFEVMLHSHLRIRIRVIAEEDTALPSPNEPETWAPRAATDTEIDATLGCLIRARELADYETP